MFINVTQFYVGLRKKTSIQQQQKQHNFILGGYIFTIDRILDIVISIIPFFWPAFNYVAIFSYPICALLDE